MRNFSTQEKPSGHNPFVVPDGYFPAFADRVMQRIHAAGTPARQSPFVRWVPWLGAACVAALMALFAQGFTHDSVIFDAGTAQTQTTVADATYEYLMMADAENYIGYEDNY